MECLRRRKGTLLAIKSTHRPKSLPCLIVLEANDVGSHAQCKADDLGKFAGEQQMRFGKEIIWTALEGAAGMLWGLDEWPALKSTTLTTASTDDQLHKLVANCNYLLFRASTTFELWGVIDGFESAPAKNDQLPSPRREWLADIPAMA